MSQNTRNHPLDFEPEVVGIESDWYLYDDNGEIISRDAYGIPIPHDPYWVAARKNANGHQYDVREDGLLVGACIGGSAASICAGIVPGHENGCMENTFNSKLHLYYELRNEKALFSEDDPGKEIIFQIGHDFEDAVARSGIREINEFTLNPRGLKGWLVNDTRMFRCGVLDDNGFLKYPHAIADMDRLIYCYPEDTVVHLDNDEWIINNPPLEVYGFEIKTTRFMSNDSTKWVVTPDNPQGVPENYQVQCHHYMATANLNGFFIAVQAYSMQPKDLLVRYIPRDIELETRILDAEERFVQNALEGNIPAKDEDVASKRILTEGQHLAPVEEVPKKSGFELEPKYSSVILQISAIDAEIKETETACKKSVEKLKADRFLLEGELYDVFKENNKSFAYLKGELDGEEGTFFIHQNHKEGRAVTDCDLLEKENPTLAALCIKKSASATGLTAAQKEELAKYQTIPIKAEIETKVSFSSSTKSKKSVS